jgi:hypothetical protein
MNEGEREILRVLNDPRLMTGEKAAAVDQLTGTQPHPAGPSKQDIKRTTLGGMKPSSTRKFYGIDRP